MKPYALISDTHHHNWTAFATTNADGVNSRLKQILDETARCVDTLGKAGGSTLIHAGDLFHVRGSVSPSVLNPTLDLYRSIVKMGFKVILLAGNHDLEGKEASDLGSAVTALREVGCVVINTPATIDGVTLVPWTPDMKVLKATLEHLGAGRPNNDLVLHAGIDGVIKGLPPHGLDAEYLSKLGFSRVFAGHYHHHKQLADNVWSIGALTHQTWGDVGTKAGFVIVDEAVKWHSTHAPLFVEITPDVEPEDIALMVDGNYVRAKVSTCKTSEIEVMRKLLHDSGARGVTIVSQPALGVTRTSTSIKAGASLETSVQDYVNAGDFEDKAKLAILCQEILKEAREGA